MTVIIHDQSRLVSEAIKEAQDKTNVVERATWMDWICRSVHGRSLLHQQPYGSKGIFSVWFSISFSRGFPGDNGTKLAAQHHQTTLTFFQDELITNGIPVYVDFSYP
jgi:hypothetical protein